MAQVIINIPDAEVSRVLNAFATTYGWRSQELDGTKAAFAKRQIIEHIKAVVIQSEIPTDFQTIQATKAASVDAIGMN